MGTKCAVSSEVKHALPVRQQSTEAHEIPEAKKAVRLSKLMTQQAPEAQQVRRDASHGPWLWFPLCYWDKHCPPKQRGGDKLNIHFQIEVHH